MVSRHFQQSSKERLMLLSGGTQVQRIRPWLFSISGGNTAWRNIIRGLTYFQPWSDMHVSLNYPIGFHKLSFVQ